MIKTLEAPLQSPMTAEAYLKHQRSGGREDAPKYEFINQKLVLMAGASLNHIKINANLMYTFGHQVRTKKHKLVLGANDMRVVSYVESKNYFYPDMVAVESKPYFEDEHEEGTLMNPTFIIEILSKSTESIDRGAKLKSFRATKSVREYILVDQYVPCIEHFYRDDAGNWHFGDVLTEGVLKLKTTPFELNFEDVYFDVNFNDPAASKDPEPDEVEENS